MPARYGILYLVTIPPGNPQDLTLRARRVLREVDAVICSSCAESAELLAKLQIEQTLWESAENPVTRLEQLQEGAQLALLAGETTLTANNPTTEFIHAVIQAGIRVEPIPGASAILGALVASGIAAPRFRFIGQLPIQAAARKRRLGALSEIRETMILYDTPNRLAPLLKALQETFGQERRAAVAAIVVNRSNLTLPDEELVRGTLQEITAHFQLQPFKGQYLIVIEGTSTKPAR